MRTNNAVIITKLQKITLYDGIVLFILSILSAQVQFIVVFLFVTGGLLRIAGIFIEYKYFMVLNPIFCSQKAILAIVFDNTSEVDECRWNESK